MWRSLIPVKRPRAKYLNARPIGTFTFTVGWNTDGATGAFYQAAEKWGGISYWTQQPFVSGDNYIIPGGAYVAQNSACYTSPSAMLWVDDYDYGAIFHLQNILPHLMSPVLMVAVIRRLNGPKMQLGIPVS